MFLGAPASPPANKRHAGMVQSRCRVTARPPVRANSHGSPPSAPNPTYFALTNKKGRQSRPFPSAYLNFDPTTAGAGAFRQRDP